MKKRIVMVLLAMAVSSTVFVGCGSDPVKQTAKQEESISKKNKEEGKTKKETKDGLVSDAKKDKKDDPKENTAKKDNTEVTKIKSEESSTKKSKADKAAGDSTSKPSSKPTENSKPAKPKPDAAKPKPDASKPKPDTVKPKPSKPQHEHDWVAKTHIKHHDEKKHKETVVIEEAWDEEIWKYCEVCNTCGYNFTLNNAEDKIDEHVYAHMINGEDQGGHGSKNVLVDKIHHDAVTEERWVVDEEAWDETIVDGYKCSICGATK